MARRRPAKRSKKGRRSRRIPERAQEARASLRRRIVSVAGWGLGLLSALAVLVLLVLARLPDPARLLAEREALRITVLAEDGSILAERAPQGRAYVRLGEISPWLVQAVVAVEDRRFFAHWGVDLRGMLRAAWQNLRTGSYTAGGSTITQQLAKNLYLSGERTLARKLRELVLALWLELRLGKEDILELYLNRVYFGEGAYGAEAAARIYFGKSAGELDLAEAAMLAGVLRAPSRLAPTRNLAAARARAGVVLRAMAELGMVTPEEADEALRRAARPRTRPTGFAGHVVERALSEARAALGWRSGALVLRTSLIPGLQRRVEAVLRERVGSRSGLQGAVVVLDRAGRILAYAGGVGAQALRRDRAGGLPRQPGSAFKLFVYLAALQAGWTPESRIADRPLAIDGWSPKNADRRFRGLVSLEEAFALSLNAAAAGLAQEVGIDRIAALAHRLGIASPLRRVPSLALGTSEVTLLELAAAYAVLATDGAYRAPRLVQRITDGAGRILWRNPGSAMPVAAPEERAAMRRLLRAAVAYGTGRRAALPGLVVFGKTGTSQGPRDAWFVGFAEGVTVGVWVGRDDQGPLGSISGGGLPAEIFREIIAFAVLGAGAETASAEAVP